MGANAADRIYASRNKFHIHLHPYMHTLDGYFYELAQYPL